MKKFALHIEREYNENDPLSEMVIPIDDLDLIEPKELDNILATFVCKTIDTSLEELALVCFHLHGFTLQDFLDTEDNEYVFTRRTLRDNEGNDKCAEFRIYKAKRKYNVYEDVDNPF